MRSIVRAPIVSTIADLLAAVAGVHPDAPASPRLLGHATATREAANVPVLPSDRIDLERWTAAVQVAHGDAFEREFATGRSMTRDDAVARALALDA